MNTKLDRLVAERVMGLDVKGEWSCYSVEGSISIDIDGSWKGSGYESIRPVFLMPGALPPDGDDPVVLGCNGYALIPCPRYSSNISAAWKVVEKSEHMCVVHRISITTYAKDCGAGCCMVKAGARWRCRMSVKGEWSYAKTAPLAICLAALRAVGVPESEIQEAMK